MLGRGNKGRKVSFVDDHIKNDDWLEEALATDSDNEAPSRTSAAGTNKDKSDKSDKSKTAVTEGGDRDGGEEGASTKGKKGKKGKGTKKAKPSVWEEVFPTKEEKMKKWSS